MEALSVSDFRNNLATWFNRVIRGENVIIRRKNELFALVKIGKEDLMITPELEKRIEEVHRAYRNGECTSVKSHEELDRFLDSL